MKRGQFSTEIDKIQDLRSHSQLQNVNQEKYKLLNLCLRFPHLVSPFMILIYGLRLPLNNPLKILFKASNFDICIQLIRNQVPKILCILRRIVTTDTPCYAVLVT